MNTRRKFGPSCRGCGVRLPKLVEELATWKMVKDKAVSWLQDAGIMIVRVVDHHEPTLNLHTIQTSGVRLSCPDVSYLTTARPQPTRRGRDAQSKAFWDGQALVIRTINEDFQSDNEVFWIAGAFWRWQTLITSSHVETDPRGD